MADETYKYHELTSRIIGAAFEVHNTLKSGFQEVIYQRSLEVELNIKGVVTEREISLPIYYKGVDVGARRVDFLVENKICVELKAVSQLEDVHLAQALNYLEAFNMEIGLLINFGSKSLEVKRLLNKKYDLMILNPGKHS